MPYYREPLLDKNVCIVIKNENYENNKSLLDQYFVKTVDILYEYPSTSGYCREYLNRDSILLYASASILTFLMLLNIKILLILNIGNIDKKIKDQTGSSFSISCL
jgi:hypothetical protein